MATKVAPSKSRKVKDVELQNFGQLLADKVNHYTQVMLEARIQACLDLTDVKDIQMHLAKRGFKVNNLVLVHTRYAFVVYDVDETKRQRVH